MQRPEIIAGLKQAIERGDSLENAKFSFINAGYNMQDVEDSAAALSHGSLSLSSPNINIRDNLTLPDKNISQPYSAQIESQQPITNIPQTRPFQTDYPNQQKREIIIKEKRRGGSKFIILLVIVLILLLAFLGITIFAKDKFLDFINGLFS